MTKQLLETLLFASVSINAAILMFFAGVYRKMMNGVDVITFRNLTELLVKYSSKSIFMIVALNLPLLVAIPYYCLIGFANWWITASLILWLAGGSISKIIKLPVYKSISELGDNDVDRVNELRNKLNTGNLFQAWIYGMAVIVMVIPLIK